MSQRTNITFITEISDAEAILENYRTVIGATYEAYLNHIRRVMTYANWFTPFTYAERKLVETALAFHDLGFWCNNRIDYLKPSIAMAKSQSNETDADSIAAIIHNHHRWMTYRGPHARLAEPVRKGDWIDVTKGRRLFGMPKQFQIEVDNAIPNLGFRTQLLATARSWPGTRFSNLRAANRLIFPGNKSTS